jgi:uncharacterized protein YbaP (TraB family)
MGIMAAMPFRLPPRLLRTAAVAIASLAAVIAPLRAAAEPALWMVKDADSTIYLIGTVHILPSGTPWRSKKIERAIEESSELWLEIADVSSMGAQIMATFSMFGQGVSFGPPLSKRLSPQDFESLQRAAAQTGFTVSQLDHLRPWLAGMLIGAGASAAEGGKQTVPGVDVQLQRRFNARNQPIHGFETIDSQIKVFSTLPEKAELGFLLDTIKGTDASGEDLPALVKTWIAGDTAGIAATVNRPMLAASPALYEALIARRNAGFADGIEKLLQGKGTAIVAIGAAHLAGPDSVQAYLATKGIYAIRQ